MKALHRKVCSTPVSTLCFLAAALGSAGVAAQNDLPDPGKDADYVFFGWSAAYGAGGPENRIIINQDIDDKDSPVSNNGGPKFKITAASPAFGRLDGHDTKPGYSLLVPKNSQKENPDRFIIRHSQGDYVYANSDLEPGDPALHYLRAVIDVRHDGRRTRFTANCPTFECDVP